jgi:hypothetical protein
MWPVLEWCLDLFEGLGSFLGFLDPVIGGLEVLGFSGLAYHSV